MPTDRKDIALTEEFELKIENGDFVIAASDQQHVQDIFLAYQGEFKEYPLIGFGVTKYIKKTTATKPEFLRDLREQLKYDGYKNPEFKNDIETLIIKV